jgi:hypothetical protein
VREAAVRALKDRPRKEYEGWLFSALRYPWRPVVSHAAEALVALDLKQSVPVLVGELGQPDPSVPFEVELPKKKKLTVVRELVRVNHLGNCLLCHAQSLAQTDLVRGAVPTPDEPLPGPVTTPAYYKKKTGAFVRGDITYLQQDFSVYQPVANPGNWPAYQRYDYLVRLRRVTPRELAAFKALQSKLGDRPLSDQKRAILFALRELTGNDLGTSVEAWKEKFGTAELRTRPKIEMKESLLDPEAARLSRELLRAAPAKQSELLRVYRDSKGLVYTEALAAAIHGLSGARQKGARQALVSRLTRMVPMTLADKLKDDSPEVRRAAVLAAVQKRASALVPEIINLLEDSEPSVADAAHTSLVQLTGRDFGPGDKATRSDRAASVTRWQTWWKKQGQQ